MKSKKTMKIIAVFLCFAMLVGMVPTTVSAASDSVTYSDSTLGTDGYYNVISRKDYTLVPGAATETEMVLNNADGTRRQVLHIMEVDPSNPDISIVPGYYNIDKDTTDVANQQAAKLTDMAAYYEEQLGYNIVGGMNTDLYYAANEPRVLVYNGKDLRSERTTSSVLCVYQEEDDTISCEVKAYTASEIDADLATGRLLHAVGVSFGMVVKDGELVNKTVKRGNDDAARSMVGVKEDGTLVICMNDGRGANNSVGLSSYEEGEIMLALDCKWAANCDGGGSSTFLTKRAGENNFTMRSTPCDGAERPTIHGIFVTSNVAPTGVLNNIDIKANYDYFAPNTTYTFTAEAIDTHGYAMDMPENVIWTLSDTSYGTVDNGVFVSNGKLGVVDVQILLEGEVVGNRTISIVNPEKVSFASSSTIIPYGRSIMLEMMVTYGVFDVYYQASSFEFRLSDESAGTLDGLNFTATKDESKKSVIINAQYKYADLNAISFEVDFGKGSEIFDDFEDGDISEWLGLDEARAWLKENEVTNSPLLASNPIGGQFSFQTDSKTFLATKKNGGQVKKGEYALGLELDYTQLAFAQWSYDLLYYTGGPTVLRDVENGNNATTFGMWVYLPEGIAGYAMQLTAYVGSSAENLKPGTQFHFYFETANGTTKNLNSCTEADIPDSRWVYATVDLTDYNYVSLVNPTNNIYREPSFIRFYVKTTTPAKHTLYFDDFTIDYSSAVDDREAPVISDISYATQDTAIALRDGAKISENSMTFSASVADDTTKSNYSGLNHKTGKIYIDGIMVDNVTCSGNSLYTTNNITLTNGTHTVTFKIQDNLSNIVEQNRTFTVGDEALVYIAGHNDLENVPEYDSVYYVDINTSDIAVIDGVTTTLELQTANTWELEHMVVAKGFEATYDYNEISNLATITVKRVGNVTLTGAQTLVSIPVRVWSWHGVSDTGQSITPETAFLSGDCPIVAINCKVVAGSIDFVEGKFKDYIGTFGGNISVTTMLNDNVNPWHYHDTELKVMNKEASCSSEGYSDRTYCETCGSVVDWGTPIAKLGHSYKILDGRHICEHCNDDYGKTGLYELNGKKYYAIAGQLKTKWQVVDDEWYYFHYLDFYGFDGTFSIKKYFGHEIEGNYSFKDGKLASGVWANVDGNLRYYYGPTYHTKGWKVIDGEEYYFGKDGTCYVGYHNIRLNPNDPNSIYQMFYFDEKGVSHGLVTGIVKGTYYKEGQPCEAGLIKIDDALYYVKAGGWVVTNGSRYVPEEAISEEVKALGFGAGVYTFDANGKYVVLNGVVDGYYYENGKRVEAGLIKIGDALYYVKAGGWVVTNGSRYVPEEAISAEVKALGFGEGVYAFDAEGKFIIKNGIVGGTYYENGVAVAAGLIKIDDALYYVKAGGWVVTNGSRYVPEEAISEEVKALGFGAGVYTFDAEGKFVIKNGIVNGTYYENGVAVAAGLIKIDDALYYVKAGGWVVTNGSRYVPEEAISEEVKALGFEAGVYTFDENGKYALKNGIIDGYYYENNKRVEAGLIKIGEDIYYVKAGGWVVTNGARYVSEEVISTELKALGYKAGVYTFDVNGALVK